MSEARDAILGRIRRVNGGRADDASRRQAVAERLRDTPKGIVPARGRRDRNERIALFAAMAEKAHATTARIAGYEELPEAVAAYLRDHNFPATLRMGSDPRFAAADFGRTSLGVSTGPSSGDDLNGLSHAEAGIAETGTLMLVSGADNPTSLNFLPENHVVVVKADAVAGDMEALWPMLRERCGKGAMPRTVNFVTGPSRSGDIEQVLLLGAHGPRALHIVIVG